MARSAQVRITKISRRHVSGTAIEWVGSGVVDGAKLIRTRATVMLSEQGARQMQEKLLEGEEPLIPLDFEGLVELTTE